jgi:hypothetical protein
MSVSADQFIQVMQNTPGFGIVERKGAAHVFTWNANGYLVRSICNVRPPITEPKYLRPPGDNGMWVYKLGLDGLGDKEERAPKDWTRLKLVMELVTCQVCLTVLRQAIGETWKTKGLVQYLPSEEQAAFGPVSTEPRSEDIEALLLDVFNTTLAEVRDSPPNSQLRDEEMDDLIVERSVEAVVTRFGIDRREAAEMILEVFDAGRSKQGSPVAKLQAIVASS